jgi:hypothetical protein
MFSRKRRTLLVASAVVALVATTSAVVAASSRQHQPRNGGHSSSLSISAPTPTQVRVATNPDDFTTTSNTGVLIPGMSVTFTVNHRARVLMHFTDEAGCLSTSSGDWCDAEILVDGVEAKPGAGTDYAIDTSDGSGAYRWIGGALNRVATVAAGTHTVQVIGLAVFAGDTFWSGENDLEVWIF